MNQVDLNLLSALKALIDEESVTLAAQKLHLSPSAMSRTLGRVQDAFGDKVLVRAGRRMVLTAKAESLREPLDHLLRDVDALIHGSLQTADTERIFNITTNDGFINSFAALIILEANKQWPHLKIRFSPKHEKDVAALRSGDIDLEIGVLGGTGPEVIVKKLFDDRMVGIFRKGHPLSKRRITVDAYTSFPHISVSRKGLFHGPIDDELRRRGSSRSVIAVVPNINSALELVKASDWIAHVPEKHTVQSRKSLVTFKLPIPTPPLAISMMWHPRLDRDALHTSLRNLISRVCRTQTSTHSTRLNSKLATRNS